MTFRNYEDITGNRYGNLVALRRVLKTYPSGKKVHQWIFECDCGVEVVKYKSKLHETSSCRKCSYVVNALPEDRASRNRLFGQYRSRAKRKGYEFTLSNEQFDTLTKSDCHFCGTPPSQKVLRASDNSSYAQPYVYNGIDRMESSKGYTTTNSVACCGRCNVAKNDMSCDQFLDLISRIHSRHS